jgi:hypothetical protein
LELVAKNHSIPATYSVGLSMQDLRMETTAAMNDRLVPRAIWTGH